MAKNKSTKQKFSDAGGKGRKSRLDAMEEYAVRPKAKPKPKNQTRGRKR